MLSPMLSIAALILSLAFALLCFVIARRRGLKTTFWTAMGFALGPFALPMILVAKKKTPR